MSVSLRPLQVTIAYTEGCGNTPGTREVVEQVATELAVPVELTMVLVTTQEEAERFRLHGSPTVLVDGLDIDPAIRTNRDYGFT